MTQENDTPKYLQLSGILRERIERGVYSVGERIPSYPELGKLFRVSEITVRRAVAMLSNEGLLRMERGRGKGFFVLSRTAPNPHSSPIRRLGMIGAGTIQSDDPAIQRGILSALNGSLSSVLLLTGEGKEDKTAYLAQVLQQANPPDSLLINAHFFGSEKEIDRAEAFLNDRGIPHVMLFPAEELLEKKYRGSPMNAIFIDEGKAMQEALEEAESHDREKLLFVGSDEASVQRSYDVAEKLRTFSRFRHEKHMLPPESDLFSGMGNVLDAIDGKTTIILEGSNLPLCYFECALRSRNMLPGTDVSVFFFEHYCNLDPVFFRHYSSVSRPYFEMGRQAARLLETLIANGGGAGQETLSAAFNSLGTL